VPVIVQEKFTYDSTCQCVYSNTEYAPAGQICSDGQWIDGYCLYSFDCNGDNVEESHFKCDGSGNCVYSDSTIWICAPYQTCVAISGEIAECICSNDKCNSVCQSAGQGTGTCEGDSTHLYPIQSGSDCYCEKAGKGGSCSSNDDCSSGLECYCGVCWDRWTNGRCGSNECCNKGYGGSGIGNCVPAGTIYSNYYLCVS